MNRSYRALFLSGIITIGLVAGLSGCQSNGGEITTNAAAATSGGSSAQAQEGQEVEVVTVAYSAASRPMSFTDDNGDADGYEVQVLREIDELLPQYDFRFVAIPDDSDLLVGIETGKYDLGVKGAWITEERLEKFVFPQNPVGASSIGLVYRTEDGYTSLEDFGLAGASLVPIAPQNAQYNVILEYNEAHPNAQIELVASETFSAGDAYRWIIEGRYDGYFATETGYQNNIGAEDSPYHEYIDTLSYFVHEALPTWPLFNRENQVIADAYDEAFHQLLGSGRINEIMIEYLDENTFRYIGDEYAYLKPES